MAHKVQDTATCLTIAIVCLHLLGAGVTRAPQLCAAASRPPAAEERLGQLCKRIASIKRLSEMQELIDNLRRVVESKKTLEVDQTERPFRDSANPLVSSVGLTSPLAAGMRFFTQNPSAPCLAQADAILDLGELIGERDNVCFSEHMDRIERYYERHLKAFYVYGEQLKTRAAMARSSSMRVGGTRESKLGVNNNPGKPITTKFFQLYANQVSFVCKSNLLHALHVVGDSGLVKSSDYDKVMPWLAQENTDTCKQVEGLMEEQMPTGRDKQSVTEEEGAKDFASAAKSSGVSQDDFRHCNARKLLMVLSNIDELVEVIESSETFVNWGENQPGGREENGGPSSALFLIVPDNQKRVVSDMLATCAKLRPIYEQTVLPIVRLARLGFNPTHTNFDKVCSGDQLIKRWFGLTLVCNSMLSSQLPSDLEKYKELIEDNNMARKSFVVVDDDDGTNKMSSTMTAANQKLELIDQEILRPLIKNSIEDELWIYKYGTTKLQRIKDSIMKKVFKLFRVEDINSHIVFRKRVSDTKRWIVRIVLITLTLVTFNGVANF